MPASCKPFFIRVSLGILVGLVLGKQIGITLFSWLAIKLGMASFPKGISISQIYGVSCLGGIGFHDVAFYRGSRV